MPVRLEHQPSKASLEVLIRCYKFVNEEWPHVERISVPDSGFEQRFRESCVQHLNGWTISEERELRLGAGLDTASGVAHEVDLIARHPDVTAILELKNRGDTIGKNDVIIFFAKVLDYLLANPTLAMQEVNLAFMSRNAFEPRGLAACLGLGIHPIAPGVRPLPILVNTARVMENWLREDLPHTRDFEDRFDDLSAQLNSLSVALSETWLDNRCGYLSEDSLLLKAIAPQQVDSLAQDLTQANSDCADILSAFRTAQTAGGA